MNTAKKIDMLGSSRVRIALMMAFALAVMLCAVAVAPQAWAKTVSAPINVSDDITRIHVNKLNEDTHEHVVGAKMAIIEKATGTVIETWTTDGTTHKTEKQLDVNTVYILRELSAPDGYDTVGDTEFIVNETEGTGITIRSKDERTELSGSYVVTLYDKAEPGVQEKVVNKTRESKSTSTPRTGDETPLALAFALAGICAAAIVVLGVARRRIKE